MNDETTMLDKTYQLLDDCSLTYEEIANQANVNHWWLRKLAIRHFQDPGTLRVERVYRFLSERAEA